jgi:hypothetical protein
MSPHATACDHRPSVAMRVTGSRATSRQTDSGHQRGSFAYKARKGGATDAVLPDRPA